MPFKAMYFSRFQPTTNLGGGTRRMSQIYEMLKAVIPDIQLISNQRGDRIPKKTRQKIKEMSYRNDFLAPAPLSWSLRKWSAEHKDMVYRLKKHAEIWTGTITELPELDIVIMDDPIYFLPLFKKLRRLGIPIIAISQNIESLSSFQVGKKWLLSLLKEELGILRQCHLVITISREENFLLNNLGIRTLYIPYYPVEPILGRLLAVRRQREDNRKDGILMVGSAKNLPTRDGMAQVAAYWHKNHLDKTIGKLIIGGYKSETYFDPGSYGDAIDFRGTLTNEDLDNLLARVKAVLSYQEKGAGALTRNCEMLIAGIPVLANTHAARSYYNMKGLFEFRELAQIEEVLKQIDAFNGDIPLPPVPGVSSLETEIKKILH